MSRKAVWVVALLAALAAHAHGQNICGGHGAFRVQVGAFRSPTNVQAYFSRLGSAGFNPVIERHGDLYRVAVPARASKEADVIASRLRAAGFRNAWTRSENAAAVQTGASPALIAGGHGTFRMQVGAFRSPANAQAYFSRLKSAGFNPALEPFHSPRYGAVTRVLISAKACERAEIIQRLRNAGFGETWMRR